MSDDREQPDRDVQQKPVTPRPGALETLYGVLFEPGTTFRRLADDPPAGLALAVFFGANFLSLLVGASSGIGSVGFAVGIMALVFGVWLAGTPVLGLMAEILGGQGKLLSLFLLFGLASLPSIFAGPVQLVGRFASPLAGVGGIAVAIWTFVLSAVALREAYRLSTLRAFVAMILPLGALIAIVIVAVIAIIAGLATSPDLLQQLESLAQ